ncbi:MAG: hypothetical protein ABI704_22195 [Kofleriaceae bacterium]
MNVIEINKYRPSLMRQGRYLRDDWVSYSNIGEKFDGLTFTRTEYLRVENNYVAAIRSVCEFASISSVFAHDLERWDAADQDLTRHGLDDVLDGSPQVTEGEELTGIRLENVIRRCLREVAWLELIVPNSFLIHLSHDLRLFVALNPDPAPIRPLINALGLFTYPSHLELRTLEIWRAGRAV